MALNYLPGGETKSAITADTNGDAIDLRGYSQLAIHTIFGTCTGQAANASDNTAHGLWLETSNDKSTWTKILAIAYETDHSDHSADIHYDYIPDHTAAIGSPPATSVGFGRFVRFTFAAANYTASSVTYTIKWEAKE